MSGTIGTAVRLGIVAVLVAALGFVSWNMFNESTEDATGDDAAKKTAVKEQVTSKALCDAVGGSWNTATSKCT